MANDLLRHAAELRAKAARAVRLAILLADRAHARCELGIASRGQIREQVVLDLMAQVPTHHVHEAPALDVRGARELAQVPATTALALDVDIAIDRDSFGEV